LFRIRKEKDLQDIQFALVNEKEWDKLPIPQPKKPRDRYEEVLNILESGKIVQLQAETENDLKGMKIAIGRKSRARGFVAEFRNQGNMLYARRSDRPIEPVKPREAKLISK
jgi:hypothetical protein